MPLDVRRLNSGISYVQRKERLAKVPDNRVEYLLFGTGKRGICIFDGCGSKETLRGYGESISRETAVPSRGNGLFFFISPSTQHECIIRSS